PRFWASASAPCIAGSGAGRQRAPADPRIAFDGINLARRPSRSGGTRPRPASGPHRRRTTTMKKRDFLAGAGGSLAAGALGALAPGLARAAAPWQPGELAEGTVDSATLEALPGKVPLIK